MTTEHAGSSPASSRKSSARRSGAQGSQELQQDVHNAGFYPLLVNDVLQDALDGRECLAHLVHLETHFDRAEVHRHVTVLVLTRQLLIVAHVDDQQLDEHGSQMVAQVSTETIPVSQIRTVVLSYAYAQPQNYSPADPVQELTLSLGWSGGQRIDMGPATCGDPQCEAVHGYTGQIAQEDLTLRVSAEADGLAAVQRAKDFARTLRTISTDVATGPALVTGIEATTGAESGAGTEPRHPIQAAVDTRARGVRFGRGHRH